MSAPVILFLVVIFYAGYNLFLKLSGANVPTSATTVILAVICVQLTALAVSVVFFGTLSVKGGQVFTLTPKAYVWAILGGLCIGAAEIGYMYLFGGLGGVKPMAANVAIPSVVCGTIVITMLFSYGVLKEDFYWTHGLGSLFILLGVVLLFVKGGSH